MTIIKIDGIDVSVDDDIPSKISYNSLRIEGGYPRIHVLGVGEFNLHNFIMDNFDGEIIYDHIDRVKTNCVRSNLRPCTHTQNLHNTAKRIGNHSSVFKGVSWATKRNYFITRITIRSKTYMVYYSIVEEECAYAYNVAATCLYGEFGYLNPISLTSKVIEEEVKDRLIYHNLWKPK